MKTNVIVNLQHEALHFWEEAEEKLPEVGFLSHPHRHQFHITAKKSVSHDDRDVEIIMLKRDIESYLSTKYNKNFGPMSCEMIARELVEEFELSYCKVLEDGENGAEVINE